MPHLVIRDVSLDDFVTTQSIAVITVAVGLVALLGLSVVFSRGHYR